LQPFSRRGLPEGFSKTRTHGVTAESAPSFWGEVLLKNDLSACTVLFRGDLTHFFENRLLGSGVGVIPESPGHLWHWLLTSQLVRKPCSITEVVLKHGPEGEIEEE
jgi:hypothetical protein